MTKKLSWACALLFTLAGALPAHAAEWKTYISKSYGFTMLVPAGAVLMTREYGGGWGGLRATHEGVVVHGVARLGAPASARDIQKYGVKLTGMPAGTWTQVDKGRGKGWTWYRTVRAVSGGKLVFGGYGVGRRGSYLILVVTTKADFKAYRAEYMAWYNSVRLN